MFVREDYCRSATMPYAGMRSEHLRRLRQAERFGTVIGLSIIGTGLAAFALIF